MIQEVLVVPYQKNDYSTIMRTCVHLSRKTSQHDNLSDVLTRLWVKSDLIIRSYHCTMNCSFCFDEHNVRSCPQRQKVTSGCLSLEKHLITCIFADTDALHTKEGGGRGDSMMCQNIATV